MANDSGICAAFVIYYFVLREPERDPKANYLWKQTNRLVHFTG